MEWADWMGDGRVKLANDVTYERCVCLCLLYPGIPIESVDGRQADVR